VRRPTKRVVQVFAGFVFCGNDNGKMYVKSNNPKYVCAKCGMKIPRTDLETVFREQLHAFTFSPELLSAHIEDSEAKLSE
jgi:site-specific DNA recombinase